MGAFPVEYLKGLPLSLASPLFLLKHFPAFTLTAFYWSAQVLLFKRSPPTLSLKSSKMLLSDWQKALLGAFVGPQKYLVHL